MKQTGFKIATLILSLILIISVIKLLLPYYYGNPLVASKLKCLEKEPFNTVFIGNSRIHHQIIPSLFDSLAGTKSFNMASPSANILENYAIVKGLLEKDNEIERLIIPYHLFTTVHDRHQNTLRAAYYWDSNMLQSIRRDNDKPKFLKHLRLYIRKHLLIGHGKSFVSFLIPDPKKKNICVRKGFHPIKKNPQQGTRQFKDWYLKFKDGAKLNSENWYFRNNGTTEEYYKKLENLCQENGVKLIVFFYPNDHTFEKVEFASEIYLGDGPEFPEYFKKNFWHDRYHMNPQGAKVFTRRLAEKIKLSTG